MAEIVGVQRGLWLDGVVAESPLLADLHGRFGLLRTTVVYLAEHATGCKVEEVERIVRGYDNEVYRVSSWRSGRLRADPSPR